MNENAYNRLRHGAATLERPSPSVLLLGDADRADFLQRMTTNNVAVLRPGQAAVTILTSPTAKVLFVFTAICREGDFLLLPAPGETAALERYLRGQIFFMDKVSVRNAGESWSRLRVVGPRASEAVAALGLHLAGADNLWLKQEGVIALTQFEYDLPGIELLVDSARLDEVSSRLMAAGAAQLDDGEAYEARRIELGRPIPGAELTPDVNPLEAGMAWACAENKGCYTGQEILARQVTYDKVTRTLVGLRSANLLAVGAPLAADGREVGRVTSAAFSPALEGPVALAIVKRPYNQPDQLLMAGDIEVTVAALPMIEL